MTGSPAVLNFSRSLCWRRLGTRQCRSHSWKETFSRVNTTGGKEGFGVRAKSFHLDKLVKAKSERRKLTPVKIGVIVYSRIHGCTSCTRKRKTHMAIGGYLLFETQLRVFIRTGVRINRTPASVQSLSSMFNRNCVWTLRHH